MTDIAMKASSCHLPPSLSPLPARGEWKRGRGINPRNPLAKISIVRFRSKWRERERGDGFADFSFLSGCSYGSSYPAATHRSSLSPVARSTERTKERGAEGEASPDAHPIVRHPSSYLHHRTHLRRDRACLVVNTRDAIYSRSLPLFPSSRKRISSPFLVFRAGEKETAPEYYAHIYIHLVPKGGTSQSRERTRERIFYAAVESRGGETNRRKNKRKERGREGAIRQADGVSVDLG